MDELESNRERKPAFYNRTDEIVQECFKLKANEFWTDYEIREHLINTYGYKEDTARKYLQKMWTAIKESVNLDYEEQLAGTVQYMEQQVRNEKNSFIRLQWLKELNKIKGLQVQKIKVEGDIRQINTIRIVSPESLPSADQPLPIEGNTNSLDQINPITDEISEEQ